MGLSGKHLVDFVVFSDIDLEMCTIEFDETFFLDLKYRLLAWYEVYTKLLLTS
jgi:hypothetical protein